MSSLSDKVAIVTGASKGIGAGIAAALAAEGARVAVNYSSDREGAERIAKTVIENGGEAIAVGADVSKAADVARLFKKWTQRSEDWTFWSITPGYSASALSRTLPRRAFTSFTTSTFSGLFSPCRKRSSASGLRAEALSTSALLSARTRWRELCCTLQRKAPSKR